MKTISKDQNKGYQMKIISFEGDFAVCQTKSLRKVSLLKYKLPSDAKVGDTLITLGDFIQLDTSHNTEQNESMETKRHLLSTQPKSKIKEYRQKKGVTLFQLAEQIGISPSQLSLYERNLKTPPIAVLIQMEDILDCKLKDLYWGE